MLYLKGLKKYCSLLTVLVEYVIIVLVICVDIMDNIFAVVSIIVIVIVLIVFAWWIISNKIRKSKIDNNDYDKVKIFYDNVLKKNHPGYNHDCYSAVDFLETSEAVCEEFLKGHKNLGEKKNNLIDDLNTPEIVNEMKKLKIDFLNKDIKTVLNLIYNYYDDRGIWKGNN